MLMIKKYDLSQRQMFKNMQAEITLRRTGQVTNYIESQTKIVQMSTEVPFPRKIYENRAINLGIRQSPPNSSSSSDLRWKHLVGSDSVLSPLGSRFVRNKYIAPAKSPRYQMFSSLEQTSENIYISFAFTLC